MKATNQTKEGEAKMEHMTIAKTILAQLGGGRFVAMTGAKNLVAVKDPMYGLTFRIGRNKTRTNAVAIYLDPATDTYKVNFLYLTRKPLEFKVVAQHEDIYCDQLAPLFTAVTGLYTRF